MRTQETLPVGSIPYGNQYFIDPGGNIWFGNGFENYSNYTLVDTETITADIGTLNNVDIPTGFARFTGAGQVILTGVVIGELEGKNLTIRNETGQEMAIIHNSPSSSPENTFWINVQGADLPLGNNNAARFQYSFSEKKWQLVEVWGNGYSPHMIGDGERNVVANSDGTTEAREVFVFEINRDDITTFPDAAFLNTEYPGALEGFRVYCKNIIGGGAVFRMHDQVSGVWAYEMYTELS